MRIVEFEGQTKLLGAPKGWNQKGGVACGYLPVQDVKFGMDLPAIRSFWKPTKEEIEFLAAGGYIQLDIFGTNTAPVMVSVGNCKELP